MYFSDLVRVFAFYCFGAFLYKSKERGNFFGKKKVLGYTSLITLALLWLSVICIALLGTKISYFDGMSRYFFGKNSVLGLVFSYALTGFFASLKPFHSSFINVVSSTTLGVYLIHDNLHFKYFMWMDLLHTQEFGNSPYLILHMIGSVLVVFVCCVIIDLIRQYLLEKPLDKYLLSKIMVKPDRWFKSFFSIPAEEASLAVDKASTGQGSEKESH